MVSHGFELLEERFIAELKTGARLYRHVKTGAELLSLINDDENKVFGIMFRTPPRDSTGVAHILEHSVLCGSRKYPVKEPFVELLKGSLKTFLNAFTYPDKTCYPVASQNVQDFYNLIDVYLDAVFYPRITPFVLQQEGWHLELEGPEAPLTYKGVVFNEMKGVYSSPDSVLSERSQQSVFPDNTYGLDSGGDPTVIPKLTFEQFQDFHRRYYHPSNARIFFCGDDDPERRLEIVDDYLKDFDRQEIDSEIALQPPFDGPRRIVHPFALGAAGAHATPGAKPKGMLTVNWLLSETLDPELNLAMEILQYILLGMPGSPLRKTLIDSGLGDDVAGVGLENELRQMYFSVGLKGIDTGDADKIEGLILETLKNLSKEGIDRATVEAALNTIEFSLRENNTGSYPRGLVLMLRALTTWLYGGDPLALLAFEGPLAAVKARLASNPAYFEGLIDRLFLSNPHRATLVLDPDPELAERQEQMEREGLAKIRGEMGPEQLQAVMENARELQNIQGRPDDPEALATIPRLRLSDLDRENKRIPREVMEQKETKVLRHDIFTNGICYLDLGLDLHVLPQELLPYVPLFSRALTEMGTETEDFVSLSQRISRKTGGIRPEVFTSSVRESPRSAAWLFLRGKCMVPMGEDLLGILSDVLRTVRLDNRERFRQMVLEEKARQEQKLVPAGHQFVNLRIRSHFAEADWAAEEMSGVSYLFFVRKLARMVDDDWPGVLAILQEMKRLLVNRRAMILSLTLGPQDWTVMGPKLARFLDELPAGPVVEPPWIPGSPQAFEGLIVPSQVNYVGKGANLYELGYRPHGSSLVITGYLRTSWLWERVRVQGGAYGALCRFDRHSGTLTFVSYRDPNLLKTIENYDRTADFLRDIDLDESELTKAIIGTIGDVDSYLLPDAKGYTSLKRYLTGDTDMLRQQMREEILATSASDFRAFADALAEVGKSGLVKVLGSESAIDEAAALRPGWLHLTRLL